MGGAKLPLDRMNYWYIAAASQLPSGLAARRVQPQRRERTRQYTVPALEHNTKRSQAYAHACMADCLVVAFGMLAIHDYVVRAVRGSLARHPREDPVSPFTRKSHRPLRFTTSAPSDGELDKLPLPPRNRLRYIWAHPPESAMSRAIVGLILLTLIAIAGCASPPPAEPRTLQEWGGQLPPRWP